MTSSLPGGAIRKPDNVAETTTLATNFVFQAR